MTSVHDIPLPQGPFPLIDADPHFARVVRFYRPSDYLVWAGFTASGPIIDGLSEYVPYTASSKSFRESVEGFLYSTKSTKSIFKNYPSIALGALAGFLYTYNRSSARFFGATENSREVEKDLKELKLRAKKGLPLYGTSYLPENLQDLAARYSRLAQLKLYIFPWFNFVNHNNHGVDVAKYYE
ncbi:C-terminal of NADH-ubiquinone oxidoreductase 21 kDa subunit-domain-containing protein [Lipomyces japonicus]|uniref:C-terminal of NADH-ubiquinone oxidoreductase 21 kDa subunit-domain-containing protein n=1 Tax=Lipomyces japonicus TaxID=56871 RepID=UPI0034CD7641